MKPGNVILEEDTDTVKIIDLGISNKMAVTKRTSSAAKGTFYYRSPEMHEGALSSKVDIWAYGCIMLEIATGQGPYEDIKLEHILRKKMLVEKVNPYYHMIRTNREAVQWVRDNPDF